MTSRKRAHREDGAGEALARKAREAELEWRSTLAGEVDVPAGEIRETRREREARLIYQAQQGDGRAAEKIAELLQRARADAAERERLRNHRRRPHKHVPSGLVQWPYVVDEDGELRLVPDGEPHTGKYLAVRPGAGEVDRWQRVTPELAREARMLRGVFDLRLRSVPKFGGELAPLDEIARADAERARDEGGTCGHVHFTLGGGRSIAPEVADAIREAAKIVSGVWISMLLGRVEDARVVEEQRARGHKPAEQHAEAFSPKAILVLLYMDLLYLRLELPAHIDEHVIAWVLERLAVGVTRGGGKSGKIAGPQMRELLADPEKLAAAMATGPTKSRPNS